MQRLQRYKEQREQRQREQRQREEWQRAHTAGCREYARERRQRAQAAARRVAELTSNPEQSTLSPSELDGTEMMLRLERSAANEGFGDGSLAGWSVRVDGRDASGKLAG